MGKKKIKYKSPVTKFNANEGKGKGLTVIKVNQVLKRMGIKK